MVEETYVALEGALENQLLSHIVGRREAVRREGIDAVLRRVEKGRLHESSNSQSNANGGVRRIGGCSARWGILLPFFSVGKNLGPLVGDRLQWLGEGLGEAQ